jgi:hypothetical protein
MSNDERILARIGAYGAIFGFIVGLLSGYLLLAAAGFDPSAFSTRGSYWREARTSSDSCAGVP